jgi:hypothetical protein
VTVQRPDRAPSAVESLLAELERAIGRDLYNALRALQDLRSLPTVLPFLLQRSMRDVIDSMPWPVLQNALAQTQRRLEQVRELGWRAGLYRLPPPLLQLPDLRLDLGAYAQQKPAVLEAMRRQDLSTITAITEESRNALRDLLTEGLRQGRPPADLARSLREVIGLNRPQARVLANFRATLEAAGRDPAQIERMVARKSGALLNQRARVIATNETMRALNEGKRAQWDRLVEEGHLSSSDWEREWVTAADERTCRICLPFHGARADLGGAFTSRDGTVSSGPPEHVLCRCIERLVLRGFRQGEAPAPARDRMLAGLRAP